MAKPKSPVAEINKKLRTRILNTYLREADVAALVAGRAYRIEIRAPKGGAGICLTIVPPQARYRYLTPRASADSMAQGVLMPEPIGSD